MCVCVRRGYILGSARGKGLKSLFLFGKRKNLFLFGKAFLGCLFLQFGFFFKLHYLIALNIGLASLWERPSPPSLQSFQVIYAQNIFIYLSNHLEMLQPLQQLNTMCPEGDLYMFLFL